MRFDYTDFNKGRALNKKATDALVLEVAKKLTLDVDRNLKLASPVDSGAFRAAWTAETPERPYQNGTVSNATKYAVPLVNGHSPQAPAGWLEGHARGHHRCALQRQLGSLP